MGKIAVGLTAAFWLVMMGLLFRADVLPHYIVDDNPGYHTVMRGIETPVVRSMAVLQDGEEVGTSDTVITPWPEGGWSIANSTSIRVRVLGLATSNVTAVLNVTIDQDTQLDELSLDVDIGTGQRAELRGKREGDRLNLTFRSGELTMSESIPYDDAILASYFNPFPLGARLKEGQRWRTKFLDPISQRTQTIEVRVLGREPIELSVRKGEPPVTFDAFRVVTNWDGMDLYAWATEDGVVLKEETPLGYTLVYREPDHDQH